MEHELVGAYEHDADCDEEDGGVDAGRVGDGEEEAVDEDGEEGGEGLKERQRVLRVTREREWTKRVQKGEKRVSRPTPR